jgi:chromosome segregation ATPase
MTNDIVLDDIKQLIEQVVNVRLQSIDEAIESLNAKYDNIIEKLEHRYNSHQQSFDAIDVALSTETSERKSAIDDLRADYEKHKQTLTDWAQTEYLKLHNLIKANAQESNQSIARLQAMIDTLQSSLQTAIAINDTRHEAQTALSSNVSDLYNSVRTMQTIIESNRAETDYLAADVDDQRLRLQRITEELFGNVDSSRKSLRETMRTDMNEIKTTLSTLVERQNENTASIVAIEIRNRQIDSVLRGALNVIAMIPAGKASRLLMVTLGGGFLGLLGFNVLDSLF